MEGVAGNPDSYTYRTEVIEADHDGECGCRSACELELHVCEDDKSFIAEAREDIPFLLNLAAHLQEQAALAAASALHEAAKAMDRDADAADDPGAFLRAEASRLVHECGHTRVRPGCGGCNPGAVGYVMDDNRPSVWRAFYPERNTQEVEASQ